MKKFSGLLRLLLTILVFFLIFQKAQPARFFSLLKQIKPQIFVLSVAFNFLAIAFQTYRWKYFLNDSTSFFTLLRIYLVSFFLGNFLPSGGLDVVRGYYISNGGKRFSEGFAVVVIDRLTGFIAVALLSLVAVSIGFNLPADLKKLIFAAAAGLIAVMILSFNKFFYKTLRSAMLLIKVLKIGERFARFYDTYYDFRNSKLRVFVGILISFGVQFSYAISAYFAMRSIGLEYPLYRFLFFVPLINMIAMIPVTVSGIGLREGGFVALFSSGLGREGAILTSLLYYLSGVFASLVGGVLYLTKKVK